MNILIAVNNNFQKWYDALEQSPERPRLPLTYGFGAAFYQRGHQLLGINFSNSATQLPPTKPFKALYPKEQLLQAIKNTDLAMFWARDGISAVFKQALLPRPRRCVLLGSYVWQIGKCPTLKTKGLAILSQLAARFARGVIVMTSEQLKLAKKTLPSTVPVIQFTYGIDTAFYRLASSFSDVPENYRFITEKILAKPYIIMPGNQQRCDHQVLDMIAQSELRAVRVAQYSSSNPASWFRKQIQKRGITDRCFFFEGISSSFLRFLLQHASAYAGLVDSTWQPAGWTVACEALASGLPVVIYEGLVSRELKNLGAEEGFLHTIPMGDTNSFQIELERIVVEQRKSESIQKAQNFALTQLDLEVTGSRFVKQVEDISCL